MVALMITAIATFVVYACAVMRIAQGSKVHTHLTQRERSVYVLGTAGIRGYYE